MKIKLNSSQSNNISLGVITPSTNVQVETQTYVTVNSNPQSTNEVVLAGIPGPIGPTGPIGPAAAISSAVDADMSNLVNGSILVYKATTQKWTSTTILDAQNMEGGEF